MSGHLSDDQIKRYRDRTMPATEALSADDHLAACDACYQRSAIENDLLRVHDAARSMLVSAGAPDEHLVYDQLVAYVDSKLDTDERHAIEAHFVSYVDSKLDSAERHAIEAHLEICPQCEADVSELASVKHSFSPDKEFTPRSTRSLFARVATLGRATGARFALQIAAGALAVALFGWIATFPLRTEMRKALSTAQEQRVTLDRMQAGLDALRAENATLANDLKASRSELEEFGDRLAEAGFATATTPVSIKDGGRVVTLDTNGMLSGVNSLSPRERQLLKTVLITGRLKTPRVLASLAGPHGSLMGGGGSGTDPYPLLSPVGTVIITDRPTLRWRPVEGASGYVASVFDMGMNEVAASSQLQATEWTLSSPLKRGRVYLWQVRAVKEGMEIRLPSPDAPDAKFKVIEASKVAAIERAKLTHNDSHLLLAILYADAGLLDEAGPELEVLAQSNQQSRLVERLLRSLRAAKGNGTSPL